jgi:hypothetical protein
MDGMDGMDRADGMDGMDGRGRNTAAAPRSTRIVTCGPSIGLQAFDQGWQLLQRDGQRAEM